MSVTKVIKRDGTIVDFDLQKIIIAIGKANAAVEEAERLDEDRVRAIAAYVQRRDKNRLLVEDIQDMVERQLQEAGKFELAKAYIIYRYRRALVRKSNTTDESILSLIRNSNKDVMEENSNKNAVMASTQRDLIAGEVSKDLTRRVILPEKISKAHDEGVLHFHDMDYFIQPRRHAGQRHGHEWQAHRVAEELPGGVQRDDPDHRVRRVEPVRRPVRRCVPSGQVPAPQQGEIHEAGV